MINNMMYREQTIQDYLNLYEDTETPEVFHIDSFVNYVSLKIAESTYIADYTLAPVFFLDRIAREPCSLAMDFKTVESITTLRLEAIDHIVGDCDTAEQIKAECKSYMQYSYYEEGSNGTFKTEAIRRVVRNFLNRFCDMPYSSDRLVTTSTGPAKQGMQDLFTPLIEAMIFHYITTADDELDNYLSRDVVKLSLQEANLKAGITKTLDFFRATFFFSSITGNEIRYGRV